MGCYTGFCTKNGDGETASCGCLSMRPTDSSNHGKLKAGWPSAVLIQSSSFRSALREYIDGDSDKAERTLKAAIKSKAVWDDYGFDSTPDRISLFSSGNEYFDTAGDVTTCDDDDGFDFAQCMGAPCWDKEYDSIWNITCICPYTKQTSGSCFESRTDICSDASKSSDCALV